MKSIDIGPDGMAEHIVRFHQLQPKKGNYEALGMVTVIYGNHPGPNAGIVVPQSEIDADKAAGRDI